MSISIAHTGLHIPESAALFGVPNNVNAGRFETRHAEPKCIAANSNNRVLERQMMLDSQAHEAMHYLAKGEAIGSYNTSLTSEGLQLLRSPGALVARLLDASLKDYHEGDALVSEAVALGNPVWGKKQQIVLKFHKITL